MCRRCRRWRSRRWRGLHRGAFRRQYAFDCRFRTGCGCFAGRTQFFRGFRNFDHLVTGRQRFALVQIIVTQARDGVVGCFQVGIRNDRDRYPLACLKLLNIKAFFIQQKSRYIDRHLRVYGRGVVLHRLFLQDAQNVQRSGFSAADVAGTMAARARLMTGFTERRTQALA